MNQALNSPLVIGISSRALFDLKKEDDLYKAEGLEAYTQYQIKHEDSILDVGAGFPLVKAILKLNEFLPNNNKSEVVLMSKNNADTSLRIFNSIKHHELDITRAALTSGESLVPYLEAYGVDLYLSATRSDVVAAVNAGVAAAFIYEPPKASFNPSSEQLRIAFDGDAVIFSEESENIYQQEGLAAFLKHEERNASQPLPDGPFAKLLKTLSFLQSNIHSEPSPIRTALVTARNSPAHERVIRTLRVWGVRVDEVFFLGGIPKTEILRAFRAHIFFDDSHLNLLNSSKHVPCAQVPSSRFE